MNDKLNIRLQKLRGFTDNKENKEIEDEVVQITGLDFTFRIGKNNGTIYMTSTASLPIIVK